MTIFFDKTGVVHGSIDGIETIENSFSMPNCETLKVEGDVAERLRDESDPLEAYMCKVVGGELKLPSQRQIEKFISDDPSKIVVI